MKAPGTTYVRILCLALMSLGAVVAIRAFGETEGALYPLLLLPVFAAITFLVRGLTAGTGLFLAISNQLIWPQENTATRVVAETVTLLIMALCGEIYVNRVRSRQDPQLAHLADAERLLKASREIASLLKVEDGAGKALDTMRELLPEFQSGIVFLLDQNGHTMRMAGAKGLSNQDMSFTSFSLKERSDGWNPGEDESRVIAHAEASDRFARIDRRAFSALNIPLRMDGEVVGLLYIGSEERDAFSQQDLHRSRVFADHLGFSLHRMKVQEGLQDMAYTDGMTGLLNYRAFRRHLQEEMRRASRYRHNLSLLLLDVDDFKGINDRYGHQAGDELLTSLARSISSNVRETDFTARYGGEEFVVICPETSQEAAVQLAERIRTRIESDLYRIKGHGDVRISVSVGVATFPKDAPGEQTLVHESDAALYHAKRTGKNRVVAAGTFPISTTAE